MAAGQETDHSEENQEEELYEHHRIVADPGQDLIRIDKFLYDRLPNTSRNKIQNAAKSGNIRINDDTIKPSYKIKPGDVVSVVLPYPVRDKEIIPENIPLQIEYEDDAVLVVNKEAGMVVHPGYNNYSGTLVNALMYHFDDLPDADPENTRPGLVHRLDKNTTGLMVIAKTEDALTKLSGQFFNRTTERTYHALVWGDFEEEEGTIEGHIGRSLKDRKIMQVFAEGDQGKHAITHYKVLERFGYVTLVECKLETGRTHQIRIHFKHIGHTLFGDPEYGGDKILKGTTFSKYRQFIENCLKICNRQALHAKTLGFEHPVTGEFMRFDSDLPQDMQQIIEKWKRYTSSRS